MNEIKVFQTGRQYTDKGQRIAYTWDNDNIYFADVDRGIDGVFPNTLNEEHVKSSWVLYLYDRNGDRDFRLDELPIREALRYKALHF